MGQSCKYSLVVFVLLFCVHPVQANLCFKAFEISGLKSIVTYQTKESPASQPAALRDTFSPRSKGRKTDVDVAKISEAIESLSLAERRAYFLAKMYQLRAREINDYVDIQLPSSTALKSIRTRMEAKKKMLANRQREVVPNYAKDLYLDSLANYQARIIGFEVRLRSLLHIMPLDIEMAKQMTPEGGLAKEPTPEFYQKRFELDERFSQLMEGLDNSAEMKDSSEKEIKVSRQALLTKLDTDAQSLLRQLKDLGFDISLQALADLQVEWVTIFKGKMPMNELEYVKRYDRYRRWAYY